MASPQRLAVLLALCCCLSSTSAFVLPITVLRAVQNGKTATVSTQMQLRSEQGVAEMRVGTQRREVSSILGAIAVGLLVQSPATSLAAPAPSAEASAAPLPQISLSKFYEALAAQEVELVEFDGPKFEKAFVTIKGKEYMIGEGYVQESSVSSVGPQQVLAKIKNEMKAGNPVKWKWRLASNFKKAKPESDVRNSFKPLKKKEPAAEPKSKDAAKETPTGEKGAESPSFLGIPLPKKLGS